MEKLSNVDWNKHEHTFSGKEKQEIRSRHYEKGGVTIRNIYGKDARNVGNRTLASFQINVSNLSGRITTKTDTVVDEWGPFDFLEIIRNLDEEFSAEIKESNRQPGFYSLKDDRRIEYRSLPNLVVSIGMNNLVRRIEKCL
jgi:hypothetical protein